MSPSQPEVVYWDSDPFLGYLQQEADKFERCKATLQQAKDGHVLIVTSTLTLAEVLWMRNAPKIQFEKSVIVRRFFAHSYIRLRAVTRRVAELAQDLVWHHDIRPKDAIHVATALEAEVRTLETFDDGLIKKSGRIGSGSLIIRLPLLAAQPELPGFNS